MFEINTSSKTKVKPAGDADETVSIVQKSSASAKVAAFTTTLPRPSRRHSMGVAVSPLKADAGQNFIVHPLVGEMRRIARRQSQLEDLDYNLPSLDFLSDKGSNTTNNSTRSCHHLVSPSIKVRAQSINNGNTKFSLEVQTFALSVLVQEQQSELAYKFSLDEIPPNPTVDNAILFKDIRIQRHLSYGSNSTLGKATFKGNSIIFKLIKDAPLNLAVAQHEFQEEHKILTRISHAHIMGYYGTGWLESPLNKDIRRQFLVLECLEGGTLLDLISEKPILSFSKNRFTPKHILEIARSFADALYYLHEEFHPHAMIIHRDLKPDNIAFTRSGILKIIDFGLCAIVKKKSRSDQTYAMTGNTGSLRYMAPEIVMCEPYNEMVDIYSFAIIIWEVCTGIKPFKGLGYADFIQKIVRDGERPSLELLSKCSGISNDFADLVHSCWSRDPRDRHPASVILARLQQLDVKMFAGVTRSQSCCVS